MLTLEAKSTKPPREVYTRMKHKPDPFSPRYSFLAVLAWSMLFAPTFAFGQLSLTNRGFVTSTGSFTGALETDTRVELTGAGSVLSLVWKTDGLHAPANPTVESVGLEFDLYNESQLIAFGEESGNSPISSVSAPFALPLNTFFDLKIVDTGSTASVYIDGDATPALQFNYDPTLLAGDGQLEIYSREGNRSAILDYITVTSLLDDTVLLNDTFSGNSLDTTLWTPTSPFEGSSVTVGSDSSSVPDTTGTIGLLSLSFVGLAMFRRRLAI